ncbi:hypothetical protein [Methylomonas methanica]|uniref:Uncharacterized protein n=1 Tax=Methylomonas methanica (strain DSM 25384 / MC09) TaxID=857087 RepID=G0A5P7_METMM|nr:hypothetical protein [Methylomonas methanica]AEG02904.1 hypothetical protein Metme_4565 [Methylomonas methanica MC09]
MTISSYTEWREEILEHFAKMFLDKTSTEVHVSPSGVFSLEISTYSGWKDSWNYSRGILRYVATGQVITDIIRNYGMFWFTWVVQQTGREFLLCGEDYQGYNVIEPALGTNIVTFPAEAFKGHGFCWAAVHPSPDGRTLAVEGCFWACPYELVFFDFSEPQRSPLPELHRVQDFESFGRWLNSDECSFTVGEGENITNSKWARFD